MVSNPSIEYLDSDSIMEFILNPVERDSFLTMDEDSEDSLQLDVVDTVDDINKDEWNGVVDRADEGCLFHKYEWLAAVEHGLDQPAKHLLIEKDTNLIALYPNFEVEYEKAPVTRLTSLYPGFGGPVATTDSSVCFSMFAEHIPNVSPTRAIVHKIRAKEPEYLGYNNLFKTHGYRPTRDGCRFLLDLTEGYDEVLSKMRSSRRRRIRKGKENDYEIVEEELSVDNIRRFHDAYSEAMERVGGTAFPLSFLTHLRRMESSVLLLSLYIDGEYAGGAIELTNENTGYINGWLMGIPEEYYDYNASELLYDGVINWGVENGYETYDMGYTSSDATDGLYTYKKSFGGEIVPNFSWERSCSPVWPLVRTGRDLYWSQIKSPSV